MKSSTLTISKKLESLWNISRYMITTKNKLVRVGKFIEQGFSLDSYLEIIRNICNL